jgi:hypothetical protein
MTHPFLRQLVDPRILVYHPDIFMEGEISCPHHFQCFSAAKTAKKGFFYPLAILERAKHKNLTFNVLKVCFRSQNGAQLSCNSIALDVCRIGTICLTDVPTVGWRNSQELSGMFALNVLA